MAIIKKSEVKTPIRVNKEVATSLGLEEGDVIEGTLKSYQSAKSGCMIEVQFQEEDKLYSVLTWTGVDMAALTSKLGGNVELTVRGYSGDYCNFAAKFLK